MRLHPRLWKLAESRRTRRIAGAGLILAMAALSAVYPVINGWGDRQFARAVEDLQKRGFPMSPDEAHPPRPSRNDNFLHHPAFLAEHFFRNGDRRLSHLVEIGIVPQSLVLDLSGPGSAKDVDPKAAAEALAALAPLEQRRRELVDALAKTTACAASARERQDTGVNRGEIWIALDLLRYFRDHAVLSLATGNPDAALEDILAALKLSQGLRNPHGYHGEEPFAEFYGRETIARAVLEFPKPGWNDRQLAALGTALASVDLPAERAALIRGVPAEFRALRDDISSGKVRRQEHGWREIWQDRDWTLAGWKRKARGLVDLAKPRGIDQLNAAGQLRQLADTLDTLDPAGSLAAIKPACDPLLRSLRPRVYAYPQINRVLPLEFPGAEAAQAFYDAARHVVAVERHRLRHGKFPAGIRDLDPEFGGHLPAPPDGQPGWTYRINNSGHLEIEAPPFPWSPTGSRLRLTRP